MSVKFIKNEQVFDTEECSKNLNLLAHSQLIELFIGSDCGGHGRCKADRIRVEVLDFDKVNSPTEIEKLHFSVEQLESGMRLACQCFPERDGLDLSVFVLGSG